MRRDTQLGVERARDQLTPQVLSAIQHEAEAIFQGFETSGLRDEFEYEIKSSLAPTIVRLGDAYLQPTSLDGHPRHIRIKVGPHGEGCFIEIFEADENLMGTPPPQTEAVAPNIYVFPE